MIEALDKLDGEIRGSSSDCDRVCHTSKNGYLMLWLPLMYPVL